MAYRKPSLKLIAVVAILLGVAVAGYFAFRSSDNQTTRSGNIKNQTKKQIVAKAVKAEEVETADFKYQKPAGWAKLSADFLGSEGSVSGIAIAPAATVRFTIATQPASSSPTNDTDLKNTTLSTLRKLQNFELISAGNSAVSGKSSQNFVYIFGDKLKFKQRLLVVTNGKTVFLLKFTSPGADFDKLSADFDKILSSFKFK